MIEWIKNMDVFKNWQWDRFHIGVTIFIILIAGAVIYIIWDSWFKKKKVNDKKQNEDRSS
jgi:hypothetical protein